MSVPDSVLHKKHDVINDSSVCGSVAAHILRVGKDYGETILADLLTKVMAGQKRWGLCYHILC